MTGKTLGGMPVTGGVEVQETLVEIESFDYRGWRGGSRERIRWCLIWLKHLSELVSQLRGLGRRMSTSPGEISRVLRVFSKTRSVFSLKGVSRSWSRPSRPSLGRNGAAFALWVCPPMKCRGVVCSVPSFMDRAEQRTARRCREGFSRR